MHPCTDCGTAWESSRAADECAVLDAAETRAARRPVRPVTPRVRINDD